MLVYRRRKQMVAFYMCFGMVMFSLFPYRAHAANDSLVAGERRALGNLNTDVTDAVTFAEYLNLNLTRSSVISWIEDNRTEGLDYEGAKFYGWSSSRWWRCYNVTDKGEQCAGSVTGNGYNCTGFGWSVYYYTHWKNEGYYSDGYDHSSQMKSYLNNLFGSYVGKYDLSNTAWFAVFANSHAAEIDHYCLGVNLKNASEVQSKMISAEKAGKIAAGDLIIYWNCDSGHDIHTAIYAGDGKQYEKNEYHPAEILADAGAVSYNTAVYVFPVEKPDSSGWHKDETGWYYTHENGEKAVSEYIDGYWLDADGYWTYPYRATWRKTDIGWWYGDESGWYAKNRWLKINGVWYYFKAGYMVTGWQYIYGNWYFFRNGGMVTGWQKIRENRYYFLPSGKMVKDTTVSIDGLSYTFDENGILVDWAIMV
jgi:hypothetical protein